MRIDEKSTWAELAPVYDCITDECLQKIKENALRLHGVDGDFLNLTVGDFIRIAGGDLSQFKLKDDGTAYEGVFIRELQNFCESLVKLLESYTPAPTQDEKRANASCIETSMAEGLLIFVRGYFSLPSFEDAENVKLSELLIAKKDTYNNTMFARAINKIQSQKLRK